ncbi:DNA-binding transcriptional MocR family regulator [Paenibacillus phyllosphaerae]|uniref:DNA-binding transcriptional MocR family regulator n=1 Tax=Paenibacillus phyllosphaerae TaxID=274593 RepID=A0A7W5B156_9BACL|nr:PLP-dependent aminotransferase family protein [Paenibacillus phyllosphaerae]MBB3112448.1 DNA-binding transcriptional MocR family regulator [Paenibacillus phyllosphaerae]
MPINSFVDYPMSWRPDKSTLTRPLYLSLAKLLEQDIASGALAPGAKLPPQRELADFLDVNFTTITRAYKICENKGLLYAVTGSGTFVSQNAARSITISKDSESQDCIDLAFVASFEQTNPIVASAAKKVMGKSYLESLLNYNNPTGLPHHKTAGLRWMEAFGIVAKTDQVAIVSGGQNALAITVLALFEPGNRIAVDMFTFSNFIEIAKMYRIQLVPIAGDRDGMLPDELDQQCRLLDIHGVFLMPSCSNPTSVVMTAERKQRLAAIIREHELIVIEDDIHAFLPSDGADAHMNQPFFSLLPDQTVYICSTSKSICSGLRVAYIVFGIMFKERIEKAIFNINVKTSSLDTEIVTELILSGKASEIAAHKIELSQASNDVFARYFPQIAGQGHPLSFYRWLPIASKQSGMHIEQALIEQGILVYHSDRFLSGAGKAGNFLRVSLASARSLDELDKGLAILQQTYMDRLNA